MSWQNDTLMKSHSMYTGWCFSCSSPAQTCWILSGGVCQCKMNIIMLHGLQLQISPAQTLSKLFGDVYKMNVTMYTIMSRSDWSSRGYTDLITCTSWMTFPSKHVHLEDTATISVTSVRHGGTLMETSETSQGFLRYLRHIARVDVIIENQHQIYSPISTMVTSSILILCDQLEDDSMLW